MSLLHPGLLLVAGLLAGAGLWRLLRPPRLRVLVSHRELWRRALAEVHRQRSWRAPRLWMVLLAAGGLSLAAAVGGAVWTPRRAAPPPVLVLVADTPQLAATVAGHTQKIRLIVRLDELLARLDPATPVRLVVLGDGVAVRDLSAGDWKKLRSEVAASLTMTGPLPSAIDAERDFRHPGDERTPGDAMVYLLGEFTAVPPGREDVQWINRPRPPSDDLGIAAAGAMRAGQAGEVFVEVRRYAGSGGPVRVVASFAPSSNPRAGAAVSPVSPPASPSPPPPSPDKMELRTEPLDLVGQPSARAILSLPADFAGPISLRLDRADDQPMNDVFYLAPQPAAGGATFEVVGRPNEWIARAAGAGRLRPRLAGQPPADWLIVNEPADPMAAAPGSGGQGGHTELPGLPEQGLVLIDPLAPPAGVRLLGELRDVRLASHAAAAPWGALPLDGLTIRRASHVALDPRWQTVAADESGRPMIAYDAADRQVAIFFSVAAANTDWFRDESWPLFWNVLPDLASTGGGLGGGITDASGNKAGGVPPGPTSAGELRWTWQPGSPPGLSRPPDNVFATNLPPEEFQPEPQSPPQSADQTIRLPAQQQWEAVIAVWAWLAGLAMLLLLVGWVLNWRSSQIQT